MKLISKDIDELLFAQYEKGSDLNSQMVVAKIYNPNGLGEWYLLNSDPNDPDYLWAIVDMFELEIGSVSRRELEDNSMQRDYSWNPINAMVLYKKLRETKRYKDGGSVADENGVNLFEDYENVPKKVQVVLDKYEEDFQDGNYKGLAEALKELKAIGYTFDYYLDGVAYDLRKIGQKGKSEANNEMDGGAFKNGGSVGKKNYTYIPNENITELHAIINDAHVKFTNKDILEGAYVKIQKSAKKTEPSSANAVYEKLIKKLKDYKLIKKLKDYLNYIDEKNKINKNHILRLKVAGYNEEDIMIIYFGLNAVMDVKIDGEYNYSGTPNGGLLQYRDDYIPKAIDQLIKAIQKNSFNMGLKFPDFNWKAINKKYKVNTKAKFVDGAWIEYSSDDKQKYEYQIFVGDKLVIGSSVGRTVVRDGKTKVDNDGEEITNGNFQGGYWGVCSSDKEVLKDVARMIVSQGNGYIKDISMFTNGLGGVDTRDLDHNNVKYANGGKIASKLSEKKANEIVDWFRDNDEKHETKEGFVDEISTKFKVERSMAKMIVDNLYAGADAEDLYVKIITEYPTVKKAEGGSVENSSQQLNASLKIQPDFPYKNTANRWLSDHLKHSLKYKLALLLLRGVKDPDDVLNITDTLQYARLLKSLEKAKGESKHEMTFRTDNYTIAEAEEWARESLETMFYVEVDTTKFADGGAVKRVKMIKESDITEGAKFKLNNGEEIVILNLFTESFGNKWAKYTRNGVEDENTVNQLKNFINNWRAEIK